MNIAALELIVVFSGYLIVFALFRSFENDGQRTYRTIAVTYVPDK